MYAWRGSWHVHKALRKLSASSHMCSVCFASGVPVTLTTANMTQMSCEWRLFGDSNNPQQFWSFLELCKRCLLRGMWFHGKQLLRTCLLPQQKWRTLQSVIPHLETVPRRLWRLIVPLLTCSGWSYRWDCVFPRKFGRSYKEFKDT